MATKRVTHTFRKGDILEVKEYHDGRYGARGLPREKKRNNAALAQMIAEALSELTFVIENNIVLGDKKLAEILVDAVIKKMSQSVKWKKGAVGV